MKNSILALALLAISAPLATMAQVDYSESERIIFGVKAGANYANVWDERGDDFRADPKLGAVGGIFLGIPVGEFLGVQGEMLLAQKGFKASGSILAQPYTMTKTKTSLDIPLQVAVRPIQYITLLAGPQYSYLIKEKVEYNFGDNSTAQEEEFDNDNIRKNTLGFVVGWTSTSNTSCSRAVPDGTSKPTPVMEAVQLPATKTNGCSSPSVSEYNTLPLNNRTPEQREFPKRGRPL